ncbi:MAG: hypothetical protein M0R80_22700 [Proteobacteria bacterium]|jgi:hypothetical protein|nr:hypothetical protein [Pseudomonadota bacterium]
MLSFGFPIRDAASGKVEWLTGMFAVDAADAAAHPLYARAHALMPPPRSSAFDPYEHVALVPAARRLLERADEGCDADDLLRAIAILGHTPTNEALDALFAFGERWPEGDLARVARLAVAECVALGGELGLFTAAS